jgi:hypothetical protein
MYSCIIPDPLIYVLMSSYLFGYFNIKWFFLFLDGNIRERNFIEKFKLIYYICLVHMLKCIGLYFYYFYLNVFNHNQTVFISAWQFCFLNLDNIFKTNALNYFVQHEYHVL